MRHKFSDLDFVSTWEIDPKLGRPTLQENKESQAYTLISNASELNDIRNDLSGYYVLAADIDLDAYKTGSGWDPIGNGTEDPSSADQYPQAFKGILDGGANKHEIKNLKINRPAKTNVGLFGVTDLATIRNLNIKNETVEGYKAVGSVVGMTVNETFLINIHTHRDKVIAQTDQAGGLVGKFQGFIFEAVNESEVEGGNHIGGIVGEVYGESSHIIKAENRGGVNDEGKIAGSEGLGGIVGEMKGKYVYINNSFSSGKITSISQGQSIGGLFGSLNDSTYTLISEVSCRSGGTIEGDYGLGSIAGSVKADNATYVDIKKVTLSALLLLVVHLALCLNHTVRMLVDLLERL